MSTPQPVLVRFVQAGDDQQEDDSAPQCLEIESLDSGAGTFVRITTERWVVESEEEIEFIASNLRAALKIQVFPKP